MMNSFGFESLYAATVVPVMCGKMLCLITVSLVIFRANYFSDRPFWKGWFLVGAVLMMFGLAGDIGDGVSAQSELHFWGWFRHLGALVLFSGTIGMHWHLFRGPLFRRSVFERFLPPNERRN